MFIFENIDLSIHAYTKVTETALNKGIMMQLCRHVGSNDLNFKNEILHNVPVPSM